MSVIVNTETHEITVEVDYQQKGDKGDPFTFEDFTPEEILELQQPAIEAAEQLDVVIDTANTAIVNTNTATGNANQATTAANAAAQSASEAATLANNAKGWSPVLVNEEYILSGVKRIVQKLSDWAGGTGTKPTLHVGEYMKADGTYTADRDEASNLRGDALKFEDLTQLEKDELTPEITISLAGNWVVDGVDTGRVAVQTGMAQVYGVEYNSANATPALTRIGTDMFLHAELPVQSLMRRCVLKLDRTVNYYLHPDNSALKADGTPAVLDGADGQLMVEIPALYGHFQMGGPIKRGKISLTPFPGSTFYQKRYISVSHVTAQRSTNKLMSVINEGADFAGGGTGANIYNGVARTAINRATARTYARNLNTNWDVETYTTNNLVQWLYLIEYAHFNSQLPFNADRTAEGYRQGGLGEGVTNATSARWTGYNGTYPFVKIGHTLSLGNKTGVKELVIPDFGGSEYITNVPSYRGIENPFGHIFSILDGIQCFFQTGESFKAYVTDDRLLFNDLNHDGFRFAADMPMANGYVTAVKHGTHGDLIPTTDVGGSATTYMCDYFYAPSATNEYKWYAKGGAATNGSRAGLGCVFADARVSAASAYYGFRLCCLAPS